MGPEGQVGNNANHQRKLTGSVSEACLTTVEISAARFKQSLEALLPNYNAYLKIYERPEPRPDIYPPNTNAVIGFMDAVKKLVENANKRINIYDAYFEHNNGRVFDKAKELNDLQDEAEKLLLDLMDQAAAETLPIKSRNIQHKDMVRLLLESISEIYKAPVPIRMEANESGELQPRLQNGTMHIQHVERDLAGRTKKAEDASERISEIGHLAVTALNNIKNCFPKLHEDYEAKDVIEYFEKFIDLARDVTLTPERNPGHGELVEKLLEMRSSVEDLMQRVPKIFEDKTMAPRQFVCDVVDVIGWMAFMKIPLSNSVAELQKSAPAAEASKAR